jgi:hypothetical protein
MINPFFNKHKTPKAESSNFSNETQDRQNLLPSIYLLSVLFY